MTSNRSNIDKMIIEEWRQLRFYCDFDNRTSVYQWRFYGSKDGFQNFINLLDNYTNKISNSNISEHEHYGPYSSLKIMTWEKAIITEEYIAGTIQDLKNLRNIIDEKLSKTIAGQTFNINKDFGTENTVTAKFFIMANDFDPASMDELIISQRQEVVNKKFTN